MAVIDQQLRRNDCGISAVKTICNLLKVPVSRSVIEEHVQLDQEGSSLDSMNQFFIQCGFKSKYKLLDLNSLEGDEKEINKLLPCITPVNINQGRHYVVIQQFKRNKFLILDPGEARAESWSINEFKNKVFISHTFLEYIELADILKDKVWKELDQYGIHTARFTNQKDLVKVFNKLSYFSYLKQNYGFSDKDAENRFLLDLIYNQQFDSIPIQFQSLENFKENVAIKSALLLSVQKTPDTFTGEPESNQNIYIKLFKGLRSIKEIWIIFFITTLLAAIITYISVFINQILIDHILPSYNLRTLYLFGIGLSVFFLFDLAFYAYKKFVSIHLENALDGYFVSVFDGKLNTFSLRYLDSYRRGDLVERLSDAMKIKDFFMTFFTNIFVQVIVALFSISILIIISWKLSFIVFGVLILFSLLFILMTPIIRRLERKRFDKKADFYSRFIEKIDGIQVIKSFQIQQFSTREISDKFAEMIKVRTKTKFVDLGAAIATSLIVLIASLAIIFYTSREMILFNTISLGMIITYIVLSGKIFNAFQSLLNYNLSLQSYQVILHRFFDFMEKNAKTEEDSEPDIQRTVLDFKQIIFDKVFFAYTDERWVLEEVNIEINLGDKVCIQGKNGTGKSTLCKLFNRLYLPVQGAIEVNGERIQNYSNTVLNREIVFISADDLIFNDTLLFNICFSRNIDMQKLLYYSRILEFDEFVDNQLDTFNYVLHENGKNLSTGQRRKILLLRGLMSEAKLLILDELFNGLDVSSKNNAVRLINSVNDKSFVVISHMPVEDLVFNKIYELKDGRLYLQHRESK